MDKEHKEAIKELKKEAGIKASKENLSFLDKPEIIYHNLNQGEQNGCWYFGKLFPYTNEEHEIFGEEREGLLLSRKEILINKLKVKKTKDGVKFLGNNEIKEFGLNYRHGLEVNKNFWSNKRIKKFFNGPSNEKPREVFNKIRAKIEYYMDVPDQRIYDIVTCWIIATYCYEMFESFGYLYFQALRESGKSKFKKILRLIGFNGQEASSITEASFFRTIENTKGLLCIDEYERLDTDRKKSTDLLLNAGIEKGASVKRVDTDTKPMRNRDFDVYCPKIICNITGLDPTTKTRCITIRLSRTASEKGSRKPNVIDNSWQDLRDDCYELIMNHWSEIKDIYKNYGSALKNRDEDIWLPILVLARFFGDDIEKKVTDYSKKNIEETQTDNLENDRTYHILNTLLNYAVIPENSETELSPLRLAEFLKQTLDFGDKNPERVTGWHLSQLNSFEKTRGERGMIYKMSKKRIILAMLSRGYPIPEKYHNLVKELQDTTYTTTTTTTTTTTKDNQEKYVVPVVPVLKTYPPQDVDNQKYCGKTYQESGEERICGQLLKAGKSWVCPACTKPINELTIVTPLTPITQDTIITKNNEEADFGIGDFDPEEAFGVDNSDPKEDITP